MPASPPKSGQSSRARAMSAKGQAPGPISDYPFISPRPSTTLADLVYAAIVRRSIFGSAGIAEAASHDEVDDGVAHGRQAWLRWWPVDSFFPASLVARRRCWRKA